MLKTWHCQKQKVSGVLFHRTRRISTRRSKRIEMWCLFFQSRSLGSLLVLPDFLQSPREMEMPYLGWVHHLKIYLLFQLLFKFEKKIITIKFQVLPPGLSAKALGGVFKVDWVCRKELPFTATLHLYNPWNDGKQVKIGRDGQEIEPRVAEELCRLFPEDDGKYSFFKILQFP